MDGHREAERQAGGAVGRRLSDKIEQAFDQACRQKQLEVAACMLKGLDIALLGHPTTWDRRQAALNLLRSSHDRLEALRAAAEPSSTPAGSPAAGRELALAAT
jgi:hypothetical protein